MRYAHTSRSPSLHAMDQSTATDHVGTVTWESHELTDRLFARSQVVQLDGHGPSAVAYYQVNYALPVFFQLQRHFPFDMPCPPLRTT
ncbi:hypothetical protein XFF6166_290017 [Xanthomonas citri pv. fuscans]|nr:hypothetical protein XFF6166_290017 [Xanthomonas citri pv. fuscans]SOO00526.1 hypothetical protein XFF6960_330016 [Xanthomonas citri pv. fuscans]SOO10126.1 hypothetical protein XFF6970_50007 [Xanthomonas citri pv. fuscans]SOO42660.1 hypothetical protein XFF1815_240010 [Xanthomonas citri pv. fuscans]